MAAAQAAAIVREDPVPAGASRVEGEEGIASPDQAVDESSDADGDFVMLQKTISQKKRAPESPESRLQKAFPFPFCPNVRPLTVSDLASVVALENAAFSHPEHRASPEKVNGRVVAFLLQNTTHRFSYEPPNLNQYATTHSHKFLSHLQLEYRLTTCPELSLGVFCTVTPDQVKACEWEIETLSTAQPVETDRADGAVSVLLAHIVSTRCSGTVVTDGDMDYPKDWRTRNGRSTQVGHQEDGRTVALHSLAVHPKLQGCGLGKMIMKAYLQQMNNAGLADRVALICQDVCDDHIFCLECFVSRSGKTDLGYSILLFTTNGLGTSVWARARRSLEEVDGTTW